MIGIGVPNGVINLPTVHMVQTFHGNYTMESTAFTAAQPKSDLYFGTFFFANNTGWNGQKVKAGTTTVPDNDGDTASRGYDALATGTKGSYDRTPYSNAGNDAGTGLFEQSYTIDLFPFDFDGVQGAIKAKGDEKWITFRGMYSNTITFTSVAGDGYGADATLDAAEKVYRNSRGTYRYQMNKEAGMANSLPLSHIAGIDKTVSTIAYKYTAGGDSSTFDAGGPHANAQVTHKDGGFSAL